MDNEKVVIDMLTEMNKTMLEMKREMNQRFDSVELEQKEMIQRFNAVKQEQKELKLEIRLGFSEVQKSLGGISSVVTGTI